MDKETLSNYGWTIIVLLVLSILLGLTSPFGTYIKDALLSGLYSVTSLVCNATGTEMPDMIGQYNEDLKYFTVTSDGELKIAAPYLITQVDKDISTNASAGLADEYNLRKFVVYKEIGHSDIDFNNYSEISDNELAAYLAEDIGYTSEAIEELKNTISESGLTSEQYLLNMMYETITGTYKDNVTREELMPMTKAAMEENPDIKTLRDTYPDKASIKSIIDPECLGIMSGFTGDGDAVYTREELENICQQCQGRSLNDFYSNRVYYYGGMNYDDMLSFLANEPSCDFINAYGVFGLGIMSINKLIQILDFDVTLENIYTYIHENFIPLYGINVLNNQIIYRYTYDEFVNGKDFSTIIPKNISVPSKINENVVTTIGESAFSGYDVEDIKLPDTITVVKNSAFADCTKLKKVRWSSNCTVVPASAFKNCTSLKKITNTDGILNVEPTAFENASFSISL